MTGLIRQISKYLLFPTETPTMLKLALVGLGTGLIYCAVPEASQARQATSNQSKAWGSAARTLSIAKQKRLEDASQATSPKIWGGHPALAKDWRTQAEIRWTSSTGGTIGDLHLCGATLIAPTWVLTAAHCIVEDYGTTPIDPSDIQVFVGGTELTKSGDLIGVARIVPNPHYVRLEVGGDRNDIALLKLKRPPQSVCYQFMALHNPQQGPDTSKSLPAKAAGWGANEQGDFSPILLEVDLELTTNKRCNEDYMPGHLDDVWGTYFVPMSESLGYTKQETDRFWTETIEPHARPVISPDMICALGKSGGRDACGGDSGGPLTVEHGNRRVQVAVVSWGPICDNNNPNVPRFGAYARVERHWAWIRDTIGREPSGSDGGPSECEDDTSGTVSK